MNEKSLFDLVKSEFPNVQDEVLRNFTQKGYEIFGNHYYRDISIPLSQLVGIMGVEEEFAKFLFAEQTINLNLVISYDDDENFSLFEVSANNNNLIIGAGTNRKVYQELEKIGLIKDIITDLEEQYENFKSAIEEVNIDIFDFIFFHCDPNTNYNPIVTKTSKK
jgi:hypothetical protein